MIIDSQMILYQISNNKNYITMCLKKQYYIIPIALAFFIISATQSCKYDVESELYPTSGTSTCDSTTVKFVTFVSPLMASKCATSGCHNTITASAGVNLDGYTNIKNYIRKRNTFWSSFLIGLIFPFILFSILNVLKFGEINP